MNTGLGVILFGRPEGEIKLFKGILKLIRSYLNSGIMEDGVASPRREGTPQGSPLSPLRSYIVLNEMDKKLQARGHRYLGYADDCSIYVKNEKPAQRVMETITEYIGAN